MADKLFRTPIPIRAKSIITKDKNLVSLGSCFADNIGERLKDALFETLVNPFGTLFHPLSLFEFLDASTELDENLYLERQGMAHHYRLPKTFYAQDKANLTKEWKDRHQAVHRSIERNGVLLLTLGTSHLYWKGQQWVANCHQQPLNIFRKNLCPLTDMTKAWEHIWPKLPKDLQIIVTVSPVRHLKDGLVENNLSKSILRVLAQMMVDTDPSRITYFPAYEILMDELRDYRFYAEDMLHPSREAIQYIWERFCEAYLHADAQAQVEAWEKLKARLAHRPLHPHSSETEIFRRKLEDDLKFFRGAHARSP